MFPYNKMPIIFYSMKNCGYCKQAKIMFAPELSCGEMTEKNSSEAPTGKYSGYPSFHNPQTGKSHTGKPSSKKELYKKLGVEDSNKIMGNSATCDEKTLFLISKPPDTYLSSIWWCHDDTQNKIVPASNIAGTILFFTSGTPKPVGINLTLTSTDYPLSSITNKTNAQTILSVIAPKLPKLFPCTKESDWSSVESIMSLFKGDTSLQEVLDQLVPHPCKNNKNVYCCSGDDGPVFFDIKTIIMLSVIALLFVGLLYLIMKK
jgi:hypothetical protein